MNKKLAKEEIDDIIRKMENHFESSLQINVEFVSEIGKTRTVNISLLFGIFEAVKENELFYIKFMVVIMKMTKLLPPTLPLRTLLNNYFCKVGMILIIWQNVLESTRRTN